MPDKNASTQLAGITNLSLVAPIQTGFINSFDTLTHVARLQQVLATLNGIRQAGRESAVPLSPFPDPVGRFDIVHFFRFAIVPPDAEALAAGSLRHRLFLSVTFDGGWEPYMRVIWRDLGTLLDLMLCHCEDYPLSHSSPCETYLQWVRKNEVKGGFFYAEAATSVLDQRRMKGLVTPKGPGTPQALGAAQWQQRARQLPAAQRHQIGATALRAIRTFHALKNVFPCNASGDEGILLRGMNDVLREVRAIGLSTLLAPDDGLRTLYGPVIEWFERAGPEGGAALSPVAARINPGDVQSGILSSPTDTTHGALVLLRVTNAAHALDALARWPVSTEADSAEPRRLRLNVALTCAGLKALKLPAARLERLPQEFIDGMDARAGVLGDLHGHHPDRWQPPRVHAPAGSPSRIALSAVHVVVQLRGAFGNGRSLPPGMLHPGLRADIDRLQAPDTGLKLLAVEPMHRNLVTPGNPRAPGRSQDHFGFQDGLSQPSLAPCTGPARPRWSDTVAPGELLLGYPNDRGDARVPSTPDALLDNGSFLVIRKLAQQVERLDRLLDAQARALQALHGPTAPTAADLRTLMMGRAPDGTPLVLAPAPLERPNDFDYAVAGTDAPVEGRCPFQSHVRRANPRDTHQVPAPIPRIARRGMSYTDTAGERGLFFMAYNASIAEQFEVIQRWISGGNSSGQLSWQSDPFLGVPVPGGGPRSFQFTWQGQPMSIDLGTEALVELRWGLYLFAPSITTLRQMRLWLATPTSTPPPTPAPPTDYATWKRRMEDSTLREAAWATVRAQPGGVLRTEYGVLVGSKEAVTEVLLDDRQHCSVHGYGERMRASVGLGYLGQDGDTGHPDTAPVVNAVIETLREDQAYDETHRLTTARLHALRTALPGTEAAAGVPVDLPELCETVLGQLCSLWFGLPDPAGHYMTVGPWDTESRTTPTCPGHFVSASKFIFSPRPGEVVRQHGRHQGRLLRDMVTEYLRLAPPTTFGPLTRGIVQALGDGQVTAANADLLGRTVTGVMLGFGPTVLGNLRTVLGRWVADRSLWDWQAALRDADGPPPHGYMPANAALRKPLMDTLMARPTPEVVWRTAREDHRLMGVDIREGDRLIVGIASATQADLAAGVRDVYTVFGGSRTAGDWPGEAAPLHACPGFSMGIGVLLGLLSALLDAGTLRATASPNTLVLTG
jgi:hypothetical protein